MISLRTAQRAFASAANGRLWRGHRLPVVRLPGQRGGAGGEAWGLDLSQADPQLLALFEGVSLPAEIEPVFNRSDLLPWQIEEQRDRLRIIGPALNTAPRSRARGAAIRTISGKPQVYKGALRTISEPTLKRWISAHEKGGLVNLTPKTPAQRGDRRVLVTREWDKGIDLDDAARAQVSEALETYAASLLAKSMSARKALSLAEKRLAELCLASGSKLPKGQLAALCKLNMKWIGRLSEYRRVARRDLDNRNYFDRDVPRISRCRASRPMELVFGDVHPGDIYVPAPDGKGQLRIRLIAWKDDFSHYLWVTPAILGAGNGIRQQDIADSCFALISDPHGGVPETFYLDNGGEYISLAKALGDVPNVFDLLANRCTIKARPYNGPAKGLIEGAFAKLEQGFLRHLQGWIGGDRTNKKTHAVGKPVKGYDRGYQALIRDIQDAVAAYNDMPQNGRLGGKSPRQMLQGAIDNGWQSTTLDEDAFDFAFSRRENRVVRQGRVQFDNTFYYSDDFAALGAGTAIELRVPLRSGADGVFVIHDGERMAERAYPDTPFYPTDRAGALEQARRAKIQNAAVSALKAKTDPRIDPHAEQVRFTDRTPIATEHGAIIRLSDTEVEGFLNDDERNEIEARERADRDQMWAKILGAPTDEERQANGGNR